VNVQKAGFTSIQRDEVKEGKKDGVKIDQADLTLIKRKR